MKIEWDDPVKWHTTHARSSKELQLRANAGEKPVYFWHGKADFFITWLNVITNGMAITGSSSCLQYFSLTHTHHRPAGLNNCSTWETQGQKCLFCFIFNPPPHILIIINSMHLRHGVTALLSCVVSFHRPALLGMYCEFLAQHETLHYSVVACAFTTVFLWGSVIYHQLRQYSTWL